MNLADLDYGETARLRLAPLTLDDAEAFRAMTDDKLVIDAVNFLAQPFTLADSVSLIRGDCFIGAWQSGRLAGVVGVHQRGDDAIEIGYWFGSAFHGQGYATEAAGQVVGVLASAFPERRIFAECRRENAASWRVLEKLGFRSTGEAGERPGRMRLVLSTVPGETPISKRPSD